MESKATFCGNCKGLISIESGYKVINPIWCTCPTAAGTNTLHSSPPLQESEHMYPGEFVNWLRFNNEGIFMQRTTKTLSELFQYWKQLDESTAKIEEGKGMPTDEDVENAACDFATKINKIGGRDMIITKSYMQGAKDMRDGEIYISPDSKPEGKEIPAGAEDRKNRSKIIKGFVRRTDDGLHYITVRDAERAMKEYATLKVKESLNKKTIL